MSLPPGLTGRCLCNRTRFEIDPPPLFVGHCHCESCRRQTGSAFATFVGALGGRWRWLGEPPMLYRSSPGAQRWFCAGCGAPTAYQSDAFPGEMHFYAGLIDDAPALRPSENYHWDERLAWAFGVEHLPVYDPEPTASGA